MMSNELGQLLEGESGLNIDQDDSFEQMHLPSQAEQIKNLQERIKVLSALVTGPNRQFFGRKTSNIL